MLTEDFTGFPIHFNHKKYQEITQYFFFNTHVLHSAISYINQHEK